MHPTLHVATRKGLFTYERNQGTWSIVRTAFLGDNCSMVLHDPRPCEVIQDGVVKQVAETLFVALEHGHFGVKLHRSMDRGNSWHEIAVPVYPPCPESSDAITSPVEGAPNTWSLKMIWELTHGGWDAPGRIWCGTLPGGLFCSEDSGNTWQLNEALWHHPTRATWFGGGMDTPGIHSICVDPRDSRCIRLAVSCAGVWQTEDGGKTWHTRSKGMRAEYMPVEKAFEEVVQDPHRLAQCEGSPDHLWVQHHNGIFRSENGGGLWSEIEHVRPSGFGFAVAAHPQDPNTAWFVPAIKDEHRIPVGGRVMVTRTRDGGQSFEALTQGLPQEHAYDLVYRHALDVDGTGNTLAFGSTTGSLWITEDGGDSWETLSHHLPPVYAVRFERGMDATR